MIISPHVLKWQKDYLIDPHPTLRGHTGRGAKNRFITQAALIVFDGILEPLLSPLKKWFETNLWVL